MARDASLAHLLGSSARLDIDHASASARRAAAVLQAAIRRRRLLIPPLLSQSPSSLLSLTSPSPLTHSSPLAHLPLASRPLLPSPLTPPLLPDLRQASSPFTAPSSRCGRTSGAPSGRARSRRPAGSPGWWCRRCSARRRAGWQARASPHSDPPPSWLSSLLGPSSLPLPLLSSLARSLILAVSLSRSLSLSLALTLSLSLSLALSLSHSLFPARSASEQPSPD